MNKMKKPRESGNQTLESSNPSIKSINPGNKFVTGGGSQCKERYSEIRGNVTAYEGRTVVDLIPPMIAQIQGSGM
jgi:hypothetical protein